jgi:hypothetical protein
LTSTYASPDANDSSIENSSDYDHRPAPSAAMRRRLNTTARRSAMQFQFDRP